MSHLSSCVGDLRVGDSIRYPNGNVELVVRIDCKSTSADGRTLLWIYQSDFGRSAYWNTDTLERQGEIVPADMDPSDVPALQPAAVLEKWTHS